MLLQAQDLLPKMGCWGLSLFCVQLVESVFLCGFVAACFAFHFAVFKYNKANATTSFCTVALRAGLLSTFPPGLPSSD